jgi:hypothetical protein
VIVCASAPSASTPCANASNSPSSPERNRFVVVADLQVGSFSPVYVAPGFNPASCLFFLTCVAASLPRHARSSLRTPTTVICAGRLPRPRSGHPGRCYGTERSKPTLFLPASLLRGGRLAHVRTAAPSRALCGMNLSSSCICLLQDRRPIPRIMRDESLFVPAAAQRKSSGNPFGYVEAGPSANTHLSAPHQSLHGCLSFQSSPSIFFASFKSIFA